MLTHGDLCSGIGGFALAARMAGGIETRWFCEIEPYCQRVLAKHWPGVPIYDDLRTLDTDALERVDLITAGFPCQPVSNAGKRLGEADARWLWPDVLRIVRDLRPRYVVLENVSALLGRGMGAVVEALAACGYDCTWDCIPAAAVGAPHPRDRVWIVAYPSGLPTERGREAGHLAGTRTTPESQAQEWQWGGDAALDSTATVPDPLRERPRDASEAEAWGERISRWHAPTRSPWWDTEPRFSRLVHGIPTRLERRRQRDRTGALGNAIVPQCVVPILQRIVETAA